MVSKFFNTLIRILVETKIYHVDKPAAVFKLFVACVLVQFSVLSLCSISTGGSVEALPNLASTMTSLNYWWGLLGIFGAFSIVFEKYLMGYIPMLLIGYGSAMSSLGLLSYYLMTAKPPIHAGGILAATTVVFLGGLLYGRVKRG